MKRAADVAWAGKNAELELLVDAQARKIEELESACAVLKMEKENLTAGYRKLSEKHKMFIERAELEKAELAKAQAAEVAKITEELDRETQGYTEYRLNVRHPLRNLHDVVASSFGEVKAWCFPVLARNAKVEDLIDWVGEEVKAMPGAVWQLNDNFVVLAAEGVLNMLRGAGCQELSQLWELAVSSDASVVEDIPTDVRKLAKCLIRRWWKNHRLPEALRRLGAANADMVSKTGF
jgi:hypothetical protein